MGEVDRVSRRIMLISTDRICYDGLLGRPEKRMLGAFAIYVAREGMVRLRMGNEEWTSGGIACAQPYVEHEVVAPGSSIIVLLIEPESVEPDWLQTLSADLANPEKGAEMAARIRRNIDPLAQMTATQPFSNTLFDEMLIGMKLPAPRIDPRIARVLAYLKGRENLHVPAELCAAKASLSMSRFLRVFKSNVGVTYRGFRAWRRSRGILSHVNQPTNLALFAIDSGYPDSTYFCHATRRIWGLQPSAIFAGSRKLTIRSEPGAAARLFQPC